MSILNPLRQTESSSKTCANVSFRLFSHEMNNNIINFSLLYSRLFHRACKNQWKSKWLSLYRNSMHLRLTQYNQNWLLDFLSFSGLIASFWPFRWTFNSSMSWPVQSALVGRCCEIVWFVGFSLWRLVPSSAVNFCAVSGVFRFDGWSFGSKWIQIKCSFVV